MSDKLPACRGLGESPTARRLDKLEACRTLRGSLFILSGRRDRNEGLLRKYATSFQLVDVLLSRLLPEVSTSWKLVGYCAARFSFFLGAATGMKAPAENNHVGAEFIRHVIVT